MTVIGILNFSGGCILTGISKRTLVILVMQPVHWVWRMIYRAFSMISRIARSHAHLVTSFVTGVMLNREVSDADTFDMFQVGVNDDNG